MHLEVDDNGDARARTSPEAEAEGQRSVEIIDLTNSSPPGAETATQDSRIPGLELAVTTRDTHPTSASTSAGQIPQFSQLEVVDGLGHVRRAAIMPTENYFDPRSAEHLVNIDVPANADTPAPGTWEAIEVDIVRTDAVIQELVNLYVMPGSTHTADARQHNPPPFEFVNSSRLHQPWVKVSQPGEVQGENGGGGNAALDRGGNVQGVTPAPGSGAPQLPSAAPLDHEEGQAGPAGTSHQYPGSGTAPLMHPESQVATPEQSIAPQEASVFPAGTSS